MELSTVVAIIVIMLAAVLLLKVLGKVFSLVFTAMGIVLVVWLVVAGLRWMDEENIRDNLLDSNNLYLLSEDGDLLTGFATQGSVPEISGIADLENPNSELYDDYYKVVVVDKNSLPEKTSLLVDVSDDNDKLALFRNYVEGTLLDDTEDDLLERLVEEEEQGNIAVYKETLAFKHGMEVLRS